VLDGDELKQGIAGLSGRCCRDAAMRRALATDIHLSAARLARNSGPVLSALPAGRAVAKANGALAEVLL